MSASLAQLPIEPEPGMHSCSSRGGGVDIFDDPDDFDLPGVGEAIESD